MIVDELILKLQADLADVKKGLAQVKVDAEKAGKEAGANMGKAAGTSFADVFQAVAGAALLNTVKGFFSKAAAEFNKFEAAFLRVDSIAKGFGRSVDTARKQVEQLADKGFLNLNQAASSYADAIALGFDEKQARKFIDSLSDIAAFQNTIGNGAEAVQSGLAGLLSNSAEKVENIGVPVKVLNMQYNENIKTMGKAAALQKFYNGILKESEKFSGDAARAVDTLQGAQNKYNAAVDKTMVAIGKGLEPTLKGLYQTAESVFNWIAKFINGLDGGTKTVALVTIAITALTAAISIALPILKAFSLANPFGWVTAAVAAIGTLIAVLNEYSAESQNAKLAKVYKESAASIQDLGEKAKVLEAQNKRSIEMDKELIKTKDELKKKAKELGVDYDKLAASAKDAGDMAQRLTNIEREQKATIARQRLGDLQGASSDFESRLEMLRKQGYSDVQINAMYRPLGGIEGARLALKKTTQTATENVAAFYPSDDATKKPAQEVQAIKGTEQRFIESQAKLVEIEKNRIFTIRNINKKLSEEERERQKQNAEQDAAFQKESVRSGLKQTIAEYIEDKRSADINALEEQTRNAKRASEEQLSYELVLAKKNQKEIDKAKQDNAKRQADIDKANAVKQGVIEAEAMARTAQAAQASLSGFSQIGKAKDIGGFLGGFGAMSSGLSGLSPSLKFLGPAGQALGALGGIASTLSGLFGKSDEERAREAAEAQRVREEQLKILELQANYQKSMLALQEAAAKLPFENLQRQLRLIDIEASQAGLRGGDANAIENTRLARRQSAIQSVLTSQSGAISGGQLFGGTGSNPDELIGFLSDRGAQSLAVQQFVALFGSLSTDVLNRGIADQQISQLQSYRGKVPAQLMAVLDDYVSQRNAMLQQVDSERARLSPIAVSLGTDWLNSTLSNAFSGGASSLFAGSLSGVNALSSEVSSDTGIAENLLSTLEQSLANQKQIQDNTKRTAENTSKALELRPDRERSFIDVGLGFIQSLGQRVTSPSALAIAQSIGRQNLSLPTSIGTASATSSLARTLQERMADAMEIQVQQGGRANQLLEGILRASIDLYRAMDGNSATVSTFDDAAATAFLSDRQRRSY